MTPARRLLVLLLHHPWRWVFWLMHASGWRSASSRAWRAIFERRYRAFPLPVVRNVAELEALLGRLRWRPDALGGIVDIISSPQRVQAKLEAAEAFEAMHWQEQDAWRRFGQEWLARADVREIFWSTVHRLDCDDFAVYAAAILPARVVRYFVSANWWTVDGRMRGHAVCVWLDGSSWSHASNANNGRVRSGFESPEDCVQDLVKDGRIVGWACLTPDLKLVSVTI